MRMRLEKEKYLRNNNATLLLQAIYKCNLKKANHEVVVIIFGVIAAAARSFLYLRSLQ